MIQIPNEKIRHFPSALVLNILQRQCTVAQAEAGVVFVKLNQLRVKPINISPLCARNKSADRLLNTQPV